MSTMAAGTINKHTRLITCIKLPMTFSFPYRNMYYHYYANIIIYLSWTILFLYNNCNYFLNCVYPHPPCQLSLWEETGVPRENPQLSHE